MNIGSIILSTVNSAFEHLCAKAVKDMRKEDERNYTPPIRHRRDPVIVPDRGLTAMSAEEVRKVTGIEYQGNITTKTVQYLSSDIDDIIDASNYERYQREEQISRETGSWSGFGKKVNAYVVSDESEVSRVGASQVNISNIALYHISEGAYTPWSSNAVA